MSFLFLFIPDFFYSPFFCLFCGFFCIFPILDMTKQHPQKCEGEI